MAVTQADVAARAGTSTAVVSYVVNGGPRTVAPATRDRVQRAIDELGYRPNAIARALSTQRSRSLGLVLPPTRSSYFVDVARAVEDAAALRDHVVVTTHLSDDTERDRARLAMLAERAFDAFIVIGDQASEGLIGEFASGQPHCYVLDRADPWVDNRAAVAAVTRHMLGHGHATVAYLGGPPDLLFGEQRERGWRDALRPAAAEPVARVEPTREAGYRVGRALLARSERPTALVTFNDDQAIGVLRAAWELGVQVPSQLALFGFDATYDGAFSAPPLSSVSVPVDLLASRLLDQVLGGGAAPGPLPYALRLAASCGCGDEGR